MQGKLTRLESSHSNLRTDYMPGFFANLPQVGTAFAILGEPLTRGAIARSVVTSTIQEVTELSDTEYEFKTRNSTYRLEIYPDKKEKR